MRFAQSDEGNDHHRAESDESQPLTNGRAEAPHGDHEQQSSRGQSSGAPRGIHAFSEKGASDGPTREGRGGPIEQVEGNLAEADGKRDASDEQQGLASEMVPIEAGCADGDISQRTKQERRERA
jgi:hypothetical protein